MQLFSIHHLILGQLQSKYCPHFPFINCNLQEISLSFNIKYLQIHCLMIRSDLNWQIMELDILHLE
jgi:hypothetical protein